MSTLNNIYIFFTNNNFYYQIKISIDFLCKQNRTLNFLFNRQLNNWDNWNQLYRVYIKSESKGKTKTCGCGAHFGRIANLQDGTWLDKHPHLTPLFLTLWNPNPIYGHLLNYPVPVQHYLLLHPSFFIGSCPRGYWLLCCGVAYYC